MKILVDTHCHSIASGHAYSTIQELAKHASEIGLEAIAITDHSSAMPGSPHLWHFGNMRVIPNEIYGVRILKGIEANIIDLEGSIDVQQEYLEKFEWVIASLHDVCVQPGTVGEHTNAWINVIKNPYVDVLGHSGNPIFSYDIDKVLKVAKKYDKLIEINNHSFISRKGSDRVCKIIARKCKEFDVKVVVGSDAHMSFGVGEFDNVYKIFDEIKMPEHLIMNTTKEKLFNYLRKRKTFSL